MLTFLYEFFPIVLFFIAFKFYGIYVATIVGIVITAVQVALTTLFKKYLDKKQLVTLIVFVFFGGMTLYFHNPIFIKWKPTVIYWIFGIVLLVSQFVGKKPIMQRLLESILENNKTTLPDFTWKKLNLAWSIFFIILGIVNIYIAYTFSTEIWVNFKLYGTLGSLLLFSLLQSLYLAKSIVETK